MISFLSKTLYTLQQYDLRFTLAVIKSKLFSGTDPRTDPAAIKDMVLRTKTEEFRAEILPYFPDAKRFTPEEVYRARLSLLPINCFFDVISCPKRLNLVMEADIDKCMDAVTLATAFAAAHGCQLRIISRSTLINPVAYYRAMAEHGTAVPETVTFFTDMDRDFAGNNPYKFPINLNDMFMATSWQTAIALGKTGCSPNYFYVMAETDLDEAANGNSSRFALLPGNPAIIAQSDACRTYLQQHQPHLAQQSVCLQTDGLSDTLNFMERNTTWNN